VNFLLESLTPYSSAVYYVHHQFNIHQFYVLPTQFVYVCVSCGSENRQRLFPYRAL